MGGLIAFLAVAVQKRSFRLEALHAKVRPREHHQAACKEQVLYVVEFSDDLNMREQVQRSYEFKKQIL